MDYDYALYKAKRDIYDREAEKKEIDLINKILIALTPFRTYKRITKAHTNKMNDLLIDVRVSIDKKDSSWNGDEYIFKYYYTINRFGSYQSKEIYQYQTYGHIVLNVVDLSGEEIYQQLETRQKKLIKWYADNNSWLQDYEAFYEDLKLLELKHAITEKAMKYLIER